MFLNDSLYALHQLFQKILKIYALHVPNLLFLKIANNILTVCSSPTLCHACLVSLSLRPGSSDFTSSITVFILDFAELSRVSKLCHISLGLDRSTTMATVVCL